MTRSAFVVMALGLAAASVDSQAAVKINTFPSDYVQITNAVAYAWNGDIIKVSTGRYTEVISITNKNLTIEGGYNHDCSALIPGTMSRISASGLSGSVITFSNSAVTLRNLRITDGHPPLGGVSFDGGGLDVRHSSVVTTFVCDVYDNNSQGYGGGIYVENSILVLRDTFVFSNEAFSATLPSYTAGRGGGIAAINGQVRLDLVSKIYGNRADVEGGGVYARASTTRVTWVSRIYTNHADRGGGVYIQSGLLEVDDEADIAGNTANMAGGGVCLQSARAFFHGTNTVVGWASADLGLNQATNGNGGGIAAFNSSVTISNGAAVAFNRANEKGGGLYLEESFLRVDGASVGWPEQTNGALYGGGIAAVASTVEVVNASAVRASSAVQGGGVYASNSVIEFGALSVLGHTNAASANMAWSGGGAYCVRSRINFHGAAENNVSALTSGGGLYLNNSELTSTGGIFRGNTASMGAGQLGGAIAGFGASDAELTGSLVVSNRARCGGGIGWESTGVLSLLGGSRVTNNYAGDSGGGLYCAGMTEVLLRDSSLNGNRAETNGGAMVVLSNASLYAYNTSFMANWAGKKGGAAYMSNSFGLVYAISNLTYCSLNRAEDGGGVTVGNMAQLFCWGTSNLFVASNLASNRGGGLLIENGGAVMLSGRVNVGGNYALLGGGIYVGPGAQVVSSSAEDMIPSLYNNKAEICGGGICVTGVGSRLSLSNSKIGSGYVEMGNQCLSTNALDGGGGLAVLASGEAELLNCWVNNNLSHSRGGGIYVRSGTLSISGVPGGSLVSEIWPPNRLLNNWATNSVYGNGGALALVDARVEMKNALIASNRATRGGGVHVDYGAYAKLVNLVLLTNQAALLGDGMRLAGNSTSEVLHCTVLNNGSEGFNLGSGLVTLTNCIIRGHSVLQVTAGRGVGYSSIQGGYPGVGNLDVAPNFFDLAGLDARMLYGSPGVTSGITRADVVEDAICTPRPKDGQSDMGAFEYDGDEYDSDRDGMTDYWEAQYAPTLNPLSSADAMLDSDSDTFLNLHEFIADTNPTNINSFFQLLHVDRSPGGNAARVTFVSSDARQYSLEYAESLQSPVAWKLALTNRAGTAIEMTLTNMMAATTGRYYRVQVSRP